MNDITSEISDNKAKLTLLVIKRLRAIATESSFTKRNILAFNLLDELEEQKIIDLAKTPIDYD